MLSLASKNPKTLVDTEDEMNWLLYNQNTFMFSIQLTYIDWSYDAATLVTLSSQTNIFMWCIRGETKILLSRSRIICNYLLQSDLKTKKAMQNTIVLYFCSTTDKHSPHYSFCSPHFLEVLTWRRVRDKYKIADCAQQGTSIMRYSTIFSKWKKINRKGSKCY